MSDTLRNAELAELAETLRSQRVRALDVVVPANRLRFVNGLAVIEGTEAELTDTGVTPTDGRYRPTVVGDEGVADKLGMPISYVRKMRDGGHLDLYDANANYWLSTQGGKRYLARVLRNESSDGLEDIAGHGRLRALLSDSYRTIDNLDVVLATLDGVRQSGAGDVSVQADLTDRRMYVRVTSEAIAANATTLVRNYRDPLSGRTGQQYPLMFAGLEISNSEVGNGGFNITPRVVLQVCKNGQTMTKDAAKRRHIGGKLEEGEINWSADTQRKNLELITLKTRDMVADFLSVGYLERTIASLSENNAEVVDAPKVIATVSQRCGFGKETANDILNAFIKGADTSAFGVMHAVTYVAQHHPDGDVAAELESKAVDALAFAAGAVR